MQRRTFLKTAGMLSASACLSDFVESNVFGQPAAAPLKRFKLGVISDEFSEDFELALKTMKGFGLEWVEVRSVWGVYNTEATPEQVRRIKNIVGEKDAYPYAAQMDLLKRASDRAHDLGTEKVRVFAFWRTAHPEQYTSRIAEELAKAAEAGRQQGVRLVLENEGACNVGTGHELAQMLKLVPAANFGANWDVGNGYWHGEISYPEGYAALDKSRISHMHLKDVRCGAAASSEQKAEAFRKPGERVTEQSKCHTAIVGTGQVDLKGQIRALLKNNYQGTMSLEPEYEAPSVTHFEATRRSLEGLLKIMSSAMT